MTHPLNFTRSGLLQAIVGCLCSCLTITAVAQTDLTYSRDVAPILQEKCVTCHNPEGIGPMSLMTYEQVRPFAPIIKDRTTKRIMPPWHIDPTTGIQQFKNDASLSDAQIELIAAWVDSGALRGDPADLPPPLEIPSGSAWQLAAEMGPPDLVIRSTPYDVIANGQDQWWDPQVPFIGLDKERFLRAAEFKPSYPLGKRVVHHGHAVLIPEGEKREVALARYGVGKSYEIFPEGTGMRVPPNGRIEWNLHYFPVGTPGDDDVVEVGLWFYPEGQQPELETVGEAMFRVDGLNGMMRGQDILIPPNSYQVLTGTHVLQSPAVIHSYRPHIHMRGKVMSMEAIYPDGRKEVLSQVDKYNHNWQISYLYAEEAKPLLPTGTVLQFTTVFDNTANNPLNPDPNQWVVFGRRGVDEMSHAWVGITYLNEEQFAAAVVERNAQQNTLRLD
ncbi:MAG: cytochrome c [Gammaproteobacteria bacterium]|nr:cytochrome c [Gammaproteobacteria bacterium]